MQNLYWFDQLNRRTFLQGSAAGMGAAALSLLLQSNTKAQNALHHAAKAKRIIYLFQSGALLRWIYLIPSR